jgi:hypothetical protein
LSLGPLNLEILGEGPGSRRNLGDLTPKLLLTGHLLKVLLQKADLLL